MYVIVIHLLSLVLSVTDLFVFSGKQLKSELPFVDPDLFIQITLSVGLRVCCSTDRQASIYTAHPALFTPPHSVHSSLLLRPVRLLKGKCQPPRRERRGPPRAAILKKRALSLSPDCTLSLIRQNPRMESGLGCQSSAPHNEALFHRVSFTSGQILCRFSSPGHLTFPFASDVFRFPHLCPVSVSQTEVDPETLTFCCLSYNNLNVFSISLFTMYLSFLHRFVEVLGLKFKLMPDSSTV